MRIWNSAWTLLVLANLLWAGNIVLGRGMVGMVPPIALAYWRWTGAFLIAIGFAWPYVRRDWRVLVGRWRLVDYNVRVVIGGVRIDPGDLVVGDRDAVVVIPQSVAEEVIVKAEAIVHTEDLVRKAILEGVHPVEAYEKYGRF